MTATVLVWGCTSGAGKSWIATALLRLAARRGIDAAPFKAQNMSNNARAIEGGEIGTAQYWQARAAGLAPCVDHNPVLLKPEADNASQVVVHGHVRRDLADRPWRDRAATLAQAAHASFERLAARHALLVVEGAGSPAEINLAASDYVNLATARWAAARGPVRALLVADIDRGGAFAHLLGTWQLLPDDLRPRLAGFVLNRFRGDAALLAPAPQWLAQRTGVPVLGVVPWVAGHGLPDEDGWDAPPATPDGVRVALVAAPRASNLDEFAALARLPNVALARATEPRHLDGAALIVLPGSKSTIADLAWLRTQGLAAAIRAAAARGVPVLGICGGMQMLGTTLHDAEGYDGARCDAAEGLALLPVATRFAADKCVRAVKARFARLQGRWGAWSERPAEGYEIRCGRSEGDAASVALRDADGAALGFTRGNVLGIAVHGLLESPGLTAALFGAAAGAPDLDAMADAVEQALAPATVDSLLDVRTP